MTLDDIRKDIAMELSDYDQVLDFLSHEIPVEYLYKYLKINWENNSTAFTELSTCCHFYDVDGFEAIIDGMCGDEV